MKRLAVSLSLVAWIVLCGFQQRAAPKSREANQQSAKGTQGNAQSNKQASAETAPAHPPANPSDNDRQREDSNQNQNVYAAAPEKPINSIERIINIVGVFCTVALTVVGIFGVCIGIKTLKEIGVQTHVSKISARAARIAANAALKNINLLISKERPRIWVRPVEPFESGEGSFGNYKAVSYRIDCNCPTGASIVSAEAGAFLVTPTGINPIQIPYEITDFDRIPQTITLKRTALIFEPFDPNTLSRFMEGDLIPYFHGKIRYRGVHLTEAEPSYVTSFSFKWVVDRPGQVAIPGMDMSRWEKDPENENYQI